MKKNGDVEILYKNKEMMEFEKKAKLIINVRENMFIEHCERAKNTTEKNDKPHEVQG